MHTLPQSLQSRLDRELDTGEEVRWVTQPLYRLLKKQAWGHWCLCVLLTGLFGGMFVVIGLLELLYPDPQADSPALGTMIFGAVVTLIGVMSFPFFVGIAKRTANNTIYAITEKRAIIIVVHRNKSITERDYRGDELIHLARKEAPTAPEPSPSNPPAARGPPRAQPRGTGLPRSKMS